MRLILTLFVALTCLFVPVPQASALLGGTDVARYFALDAHVGATHVYRIVSTGSVTVEGPQSHSVAFQLSTEAAITYEEPGDDGMIPFRITFAQPSGSGLDAAVARALDAAEVRGTLRPNGALAGISTPAVLQELGLDLGDLLVGLLVPRPEDPQAVAWTINYSRPGQPAAAPRSQTLQGTFTAQGLLVDWGNRLLSTVTARLRGDGVLRQGATTFQIQEVGHALYYLDPLTGVTEMSSVSIVTNIRATSRPSSDVQTKVSLTTTFERRREREAALAQATSAPGAAAGGALGPGQPAGDSALDPGEPAAGTDAPKGPEPAEADTPIEPAEPPADGVGGEAPGGDVGEAADASGEVPEDTASSPTAGVPDDDTGAAELPGASEDSAGDAAGEVEPSFAPLPYVDPAGRFSLDLPAGWQPGPIRISLRGTAFQQNGEAVYVYVLPLPSPGSGAEDIARTAIASYAETQDGFTVITPPHPAELDGQPASEAFYRYVEASGAIVSEWASFARYGDRAFYLQYAHLGAHPGIPVPGVFRDLVNSFRFGPTPAGLVNADRLAGSLEPFEDRQMGYRLLVPSLWPLVDRSDDGSSYTFAEVGEHGNLTVFSRDGATGYNIRDIVAAWKRDLQTEPGFRLIRDLYPAVLGGRDGVGLEYSWDGEGGEGWTRRLVAAIDGDILYMVTIGYMTEGFAERESTFEAILSSFEILPRAEEPAALPPVDEPAPADTAPQEPQPATPGQSPSEISDESPAEIPDEFPADEEAFPFQEPAGEDRVLLLGRALTRYRPPGSTVYREERVSNATVFVRVGNEQYTGTTDAEGYIYVSNLPPLRGGDLYEIIRIEAPMFGYIQPVAITFQHLETGLIAPRIADLGIVEVTLEQDGTLLVDVRRPAGDRAAAYSSLDHFVAAFPASAWAPHVREAIALRDGT